MHNTFLVFGIQNVILRNYNKGRKRDDKITYPLSRNDGKDKIIY